MISKSNTNWNNRPLREVLGLQLDAKNNPSPTPRKVYVTQKTREELLEIFSKFKSSNV